MSFTQTDNPIICGRRNCNKCKRFKHLVEFRTQKRKLKSGVTHEYVVATCHYCRKLIERIRYKENPRVREAAIRRNRELRADPDRRDAQNARRRDLYRERVDEIRRRRRETHQRLYQQDGPYREGYRRRTARSARKRRAAIAEAQAQVAKKQKAQEKAWKTKAGLTEQELEGMEMFSPIPVQVFRPFLGRALAQRALKSDILYRLDKYGVPRSLEDGVVIGTSWLEADTGIGARAVYRYLSDPKTYSVSLDSYDRFCSGTGVNPDDLVDAAREWAKAENDPWPCGYRGSYEVLRQIRKEGLLLEAA